MTGWGETAILAAAMAEDKESFVRALLLRDLTVAGRVAAVPAVREHLSAGFMDELRLALVNRIRDRDADLRERIAAGFVLGDLGDPRFERLVGPYGEFLLPPLIDIPGGEYTFGDHNRRQGQPFRIGQFPVTNAEWVCFIAAGGYEEERWWDTEDGRRWRRGELQYESGKLKARYWRKRYRAEEGLFERRVFANAAAVERWKLWLTLDESAFEVAIDGFWRTERQVRPVEPLFWRDMQLNAASQPVVGVCWYEARAYCCWLSAQTGLNISLPTHEAWAAAVSGLEGRRYPWGNELDSTRVDTIRSLGRPGPIGALLTWDSPEGVADLTGTVFQWTNSMVGIDEEELEDEDPAFIDLEGGEDAEAPATVRRVLCGGSWNSDPQFANANYSTFYPPDVRVDICGDGFGLRLMVAVVPD